MNRHSWRSLLRPNVLEMTPYSTARHEFTGTASIFLDANENPFNHDWNRYPDPDAQALKEKVAVLKKVAANQLFLGNGSDEAIDLLYRAFCVPGKDQVVICPPTYGMYEVGAQLNDVHCVRVPLSADTFQPQVEAILQAGAGAKILWLCSPNNPTGNSIAPEILVALCQAFQGLVVVDEAYADFSSQESAVGLLARFEHLVVLQTLSKAWGMAGIRLGIAMGHPELIALLHKIKPPYNVNSLTQAAAGAALDNEALMVQQVALLRQERDKLAAALPCLENVIKVWPSEANFLLVRFEDADAVFQFLLARGIVVRNRSRVPMLEQCLRITVGTPEENSILLAALEEFSRGGTA